jgi:hypothetical protein
MKKSNIVRKFKECGYRINKSSDGRVLVYTPLGYGCKSFSDYGAAYTFYFG